MTEKFNNIPDDIRLILEKYYSGISSIEEERRLKEFFRTNRINPESDIFGDASNEESFKIDNELIWEGIQERDTKRHSQVRRIIYISTAAASLLLLLSVGYFYIGNNFNLKKHQYSETYTDPEVAYKMAQKYFSFVSKKLNYAYTEVQPISKISIPIDAMQRISTLEKGYNSLDRIGILTDYSDNLKYISVFNEYINVE